jgi:hypothetical protein
MILYGQSYGLPDTGSSRLIDMNKYERPVFTLPERHGLSVKKFIKQLFREWPLVHLLILMFCRLRSGCQHRIM